MQKNFKLNRQGIIGLEVVTLSMLMVLILMLVFVAAFEFYLFYIRFSQASSALKSASERIQTELDNHYASGAVAAFRLDLEDMMAAELEAQLDESVEIKEASWHPSGLCPRGTTGDDPLLHLVAAFPHQPSFMVERLAEELGYSATAVKIHLDREIEIDR